MTQYNTFIVKLSNTQSNKLKLGIKNDSHDRTDFPHKLV